MTIEERLQHTIGFIKQSPSSTQEQLISYLISVGDTEAEASAALPLYLTMMVQFGYIDTATYEAMRDWGNARSVEQITVATTAMLAAYNQTKKAAEDKANLEAEKVRLETDADELETPFTQQQIDDLVEAEQQHRYFVAASFRERIASIENELAQYGN